MLWNELDVPLEVVKRIVEIVAGIMVNTGEQPTRRMLGGLLRALAAERIVDHPQ